MARKPAKSSATQQRVGPNLYRRPNGNYYARFESGGKDVWRTLRTPLKTVAEAKLADLLKKERQRRENGSAEATGKLTGGQARDAVLDIVGNSGLKPATLTYWEEIYNAIFRDWPELETTELRKVTPKQCREWAQHCRDEVSATRFNGALQRLRRLFSYAIEQGHRYSDPTEKIKQARVLSRVPDLPSRDKFEEWLEAMRASNYRHSGNAADLAEFLAVTGLRINKEANQLLWKHVDFEAGDIVVTESKTEAGLRRVPINARAQALLERMRAERPQEGPEEKVLVVRQGKRTWDAAAKKVGIKPLRNHDLRHYYCTVCLESGVDFPTLAKWLGHSDGGALLAKTYAHVRDEHSRRMAERVTFGASGEPAEVIPFDKARAKA